MAPWRHGEGVVEALPERRMGGSSEVPVDGAPVSVDGRRPSGRCNSLNKAYLSSLLLV